MKLVPKLTLALVLVSCALLAINGYFRVRREVGFFEADRTRAHEMLGRALGETTLAIRKSQGEAAALRTVVTMDERFTKVRIRWIDAARWDGVAADAVSLARERFGRARHAHPARR